MSQEPTLFADGMTEASVRHGVARLTFATQSGEGQATGGFVVAMPLGQVPNVANALIRLLRELEAKAKEAQQGQPNGTAAVPSGLRFET
ncbi:hypothetical protein ACE7GA_21725 [Roseomonas sp. CCTCC AB2023176]|uniref:hypothetical protein n=1 Tax=Roseomonas sp. CCTCC AB2023176 TaxID=3342640 RepID=UPI0035DC9E47